jgi:hypothetical protein
MASGERTHTTWILNRVRYRFIGKSGDEVLEVEVILQTRRPQQAEGTMSSLAQRLIEREGVRYLKRGESKSLLYSCVWLVRHPVLE